VVVTVAQDRREASADPAVGVVVMVAVDAERAGGLGTKEAHILRMLGDCFGYA